MLKKMVGKVASKFHNTFVEERKILNVVLIANEAIDSMMKNNNLRVLGKFDIEKAYYDHVSWDFLLLVLDKIGFS